MPEPLEESYFNWLCAKVNRVVVPTPSLTYLKLLRVLHSTEFVWTLSGDDNRAQDGLDLRIEFLHLSHMARDDNWDHEGCSLLEMLIAFSRRASFDTDIPEADWFWIFLGNLGLDEFNDAHPADEQEIAEVLYNLVWRTYSYDGRGGLFPLRHPKHDQRQVEIWYQFCEYLIEADSA